MNALRQQVVHNDGHDGNLLRSAQDKDDFVGLIDFGDMIYAPVIQDLAVSMESLIPGRDDPIEAGAAIVSGFHERVPITTG